MGELRLYAIELGAILRCPSCDEAVVRIARTQRELWLELRARQPSWRCPLVRPNILVCLRSEGDHGHLCRHRARHRAGSGHGLRQGVTAVVPQFVSETHGNVPRFTRSAQWYLLRSLGPPG
jgi:Family of unknown function (DUF6510)